MVKRLFLLSVLVAASVVALPSASAAAGPGCSQNQMLAGTCPTVGGEIVDDHVELGAEGGAPGSGNGSNGGGNGTGTGAGTGTPGTTGPEAPPAWERDVSRDDYIVSAPVTLSDLVNFRPAPGVDHMEPDGWMIVGLDTNFYATGGTQVQNGLLLGEQASVRFTPVRYHWTYGDGSGASRSTPGGTWRSQSINEFDPTPTSHVYTASGTYYIDLTIDFAAEYRWAGGSWTGIAGTIPVPANRLVATAGGAKTVLVEQECTLNPTGPGC